MEHFDFELKHFDALGNTELYALLKLRSTVFVVEQNCVYLDIDGEDQNSYHLFAKAQDNTTIIACARIIPPKANNLLCSIGRVANHIDYRNKGLGRLLMYQAIAACYSLFGEQTIKISAQLYLLKFYESFGFVPIGEPYEEDGIPHVAMLLTKEPA